MDDPTQARKRQEEEDLALAMAQSAALAEGGCICGSGSAVAVNADAIPKLQPTITSVTMPALTLVPAAASAAVNPFFMARKPRVSAPGAQGMLQGGADDSTTAAAPARPLGDMMAPVHIRQLEAGQGRADPPYSCGLSRGGLFQVAGWVQAAAGVARGWDEASEDSNLEMLAVRLASSNERSLEEYRLRAEATLSLTRLWPVGVQSGSGSRFRPIDVRSSDEVVAFLARPGVNTLLWELASQMAMEAWPKDAAAESLEVGYRFELWGPRLTHT